MRVTNNTIIYCSWYFNSKFRAVDDHFVTLWVGWKHSDIAVCRVVIKLEAVRSWNLNIFGLIFYLIRTQMLHQQDLWVDDHFAQMKYQQNLGHMLLLINSQILRVQQLRFFFLREMVVKTNFSWCFIQISEVTINLSIVSKLCCPWLLFRKHWRNQIQRGQQITGRIEISENFYKKISLYLIA